MKTRLSAVCMCEVADMDLRDAMQKVALEWPSYGSRRMTRELKARGCDAIASGAAADAGRQSAVRGEAEVRGDDRLGARAEGLSNLAGSMILTGVDQLWVADITYIRLEEEFVYLAVILHAYSRRVIGWRLSDGLDDSLTLTALRMALDQRVVRPGLVHHSDRGVQ
jgi:transposase InsO family protein